MVEDREAARRSIRLILSSVAWFAWLYPVLPTIEQDHVPQWPNHQKHIPTTEIPKVHTANQLPRIQDRN